MENHYNKALDNGQKVTDFNIELENSPSGRPTSINVNYINEKAATLPGSTKLSELDIEFVLK